MVQRCTSCGLLRGEIGSACPFCTAGGWEWHEVSGKGVIYSYEIVTQAIQPAFADWVPYPVVLVTSTSSAPCHGGGAWKTRRCRSG